MVVGRDLWRCLVQSLAQTGPTLVHVSQMSLLITTALLFLFSVVYLFAIAFTSFPHGSAVPLTQRPPGRVVKAGKCLESQDSSHASGQMGREEGEWVERGEQLLR